MEEREIHLQDYLQVIIDRKYIVLSFVLVSTIFSIISAWNSVPFFVASTKVMFEVSEMNPINKSVGAKMSYADFFETQFQIIKSPIFVEKILDKVRLTNENDNVKETPIEISIPPNEDSLSVENGDLNEQISDKFILEQMVSNINLSVVEESNIAVISYKSTDPDYAALIANLIVQVYLEYNLEVRLKYSKVSNVWLNNKIKDALEKLKASELKVQKYMKENDILTLENKIAIIPQKLTQLSNRLTMAEAERNELEAIFKKINELPKDLSGAETLPFITSSHSLQKIMQNIITAEQKVLELSSKYGSKHPVMVRAKNDLKILQEKKHQEIRRLIKSEKNRYELLLSKEENLKKLFQETKRKAVEFNEKKIHLGIMQKDIETTRHFYNSLVSQMKENELMGDVENINLVILEKAVPPLYPVASNKKRKIIFGIILGLFGGIGLCFFLDYLDQTIKSPYEIAQRFGIPVLGAIPFVKSKDSNIESIVIDEPISFLAECYKTIRMAILLSSEKNPPKSVLITSHAAGDGKTTTSVNVAAAIAQTENTVLLIDGDLRRSSVHKNLHLDNSIGLSTLLVGTSKAKGVIQKGPLPNLSVITAGPPPINPSELYCSKRMSVLMELLQKKFDYVVVDGPIMGVTDSLILSKYVDGTIVVAKAGRTTYEFLEAGIAALNDIKANILGIVVNGLSSGKSKRYYYTNDDGYFSANPSGYFNSTSDVSGHR